jgi:hypothetical protein
MVRYALQLALLAMTIVACGDAGFSVAENRTDRYSTDSLTQAVDIQGWGHTIDIPGGWFMIQLAEADTNKAGFYEVEADVELRDGPPSGVVVSLDLLDEAGLVARGYDPRTGLDGLYDFNVTLIGLPDAVLREPLALAGGSGTVAVFDDGAGRQAGFAMGSTPDGLYYLIGLAMPPGVDINSFLPVWRAMLASVRPSGA